MKEITILSGKGGTGKTSITAALVSLADRPVICDNDVDAADLHLILTPEILKTNTFEGAWVAEINTEPCTDCGLCESYCRFNAIHLDAEANREINPFKCEGCRLCERVCPEKAIKSEKSTNNYWYHSESRFGTFIHAHMGPGEENSGKLVTEIRNYSKKTAKEESAAVIINDGPPGIGCAAISSVSGTDLVLVVIEPTQSGFHDAKRIIELVTSFNIPVKALINKYDINREKSEEIEQFLKEKMIPILAKIPFDRRMVEAMIEKKTIIEYSPGSAVSDSIRQVWEQLLN